MYILCGIYNSLYLAAITIERLKNMERCKRFKERKKGQVATSNEQTNVDEKPYGKN